MPLIKCQNCGQFISDRAVKCPKCGAVMHNMAMPNANQADYGQSRQYQGVYQQHYQQPPRGYYQQPMYNGYQQYYGGPQIKSEYSLSFEDAIGSCFNQYSDFDGRARRKEYWYFYLFNFIVYVVIFLITLIIIFASKMGDSQSLNIFRWATTIWNVIIFVPSITVFCRRMHDIGRSGYWWFINLIPIIGWLISLIFLCKAGDIGENEYGEDPKYEIV